MNKPWPINVVALHPLSCGSLLWRRDGALWVTVVLKATFGMEPERQARLIAPAPIHTEDRHFEKSPGHSLEAATDLAPLLPSAGVVLTGHAYAPPGRPVPALTARLALFRARGADTVAVLDKQVHVLGDRAPSADPRAAGAPRPFQRMPLRYERAYGGPGVAANPIGTGAEVGSSPPNLLDPADPQRPACFGPIDPAFPGRRALLGPDSKNALAARVPALGEGFPFGYFQATPSDQRLDAIEGDEWIVLDGMHPALPRLRTRLPGVTCLARCSLAGEPLQPVELFADTLAIDVDQQICSVVWRGHIGVDGEAWLPQLQVYAGLEMPGMSPPWPVIEPRRATPAPRIVDGLPSLVDDDDDGDDAERERGRTKTLLRSSILATTMPGDVDSSSVRAPFQIPRAAPEREVDRSATPWGSRPAAADERPAAPPALTAPPPAARAPTLPFAASPPAAPAVSAREEEEELTLTDVEIPSLGRTLPWRRATPLAEGDEDDDAAREAPIPGAPWAGEAEPSALAPSAELDDESTYVAPAVAIPESAAPAGPVGPAPRASEAVPFVLGTPLSAATVAWQVRPPADSLTVIAKGTFDLIANGPARLRAESDFVVGDLPFDDDPEASIRYASDFAILKLRADVTLVGHAHAPGGSAAVMHVRLRFGDPASGGFERKIAVLGDRAWQRTVVALSPSDPAPFTRVPLRYERAFGGPRHDPNPLGAGYKASPGADGVARLPNLEQPNALIRSPGDTPPPACTAPVPMLWRERWSKLGTYDRAWFRSRWPYFPEDFDWSFFQSAPRSQQVEKIRGDEPYEIAGTFPDRPALVGKLPGVRVRCFARRLEAGAERFVEVPLRLDTVAFDTDAMKVDLVWRGLLEVSDEDAPEIEHLFLFAEPLDAAPLPLEGVPRRFAEALAPKKDEEPPAVPLPSPEEPPAPDEPDLAGQIDSAAAAHAERVKEALREAGVPESEYSQKPPDPPPPDPRAIAESLRAAGASEEEIADVMEALRPPEDAPPPAPPRDLRAEVEARIAAGEPLDGMDLTGADLSGMDLRGRSLMKVRLRRAVLRGADLSRAVLSGADAGGADLTEAVLDGADLSSADLTASTLAGARFAGAILAGADLSEAQGAGVSFEGARGEGARFARGVWDGARFERAQLDRADFTAASMERARFDGASLANARLYDVRAAKAVLDGAKLPGVRAEGARFAGASLRNIAAPGSVWERAILDTADFTAAVLDGASFLRASCLKARLPRASLVEARLRRAKLTGADLSRANLMQANLERADLSIADLTGANLHGAGLWKAKIEGAKLGRAILTQSTLARRPP